MKNVRDLRDQLSDFSNLFSAIRVPEFDADIVGLDPQRRPETLPDVASGYRCYLYEGDTITCEITDRRLFGLEGFRLSVVREAKIKTWIDSITDPIIYTIGDDHADIIKSDFDPIHNTAQITVPYTKGFTLDGTYYIYIWHYDSGYVCRPTQRHIAIGGKQELERSKRWIKDWAQEWGMVTMIGIGLLTLLATVVLLAITFRKMS